MKYAKLKRYLVTAVLSLITLALPLSLFATAPQRSPNIRVNSYLATDKAQRGRAVQVAVVMDIPSGFHVNSNKPLSKFLIATELKLEASKSIRVGPVTYPRALLRKFKFSEDQLSVYEGRAIMRFNVTVPASFDSGATELKARLRYQSCNDELCFPPQTKELTIPIEVVGPNQAVKRINREYFGGARR